MIYFSAIMKTENLKIVFNFIQNFQKGSGNINNVYSSHIPFGMSPFSLWFFYHVSLRSVLLIRTMSFRYNLLIYPISYKKYYPHPFSKGSMQRGKKVRKRFLSAPVFHEPFNSVGSGEGKWSGEGRFQRLAKYRRKFHPNPSHFYNKVKNGPQ